MTNKGHRSRLQASPARCEALTRGHILACCSRSGAGMLDKGGDTAGWHSSAPCPVPGTAPLTPHTGAACPQGGDDGSVTHMGTAVLETRPMAQSHDIHVPQPRQGQVPLLHPPAGACCGKS